MKRNTLKGWLPTTILALVLTFGATFANAGVVVGGMADTCTVVSTKSIVETLKDFIKEMIGADIKAPAPCVERVDSGVVVGG